MSIPISEFSTQTYLESDCDPIVFQTSLTQFIQQFSLTGGCLLRLDSNHKLQQLSYYNASPDLAKTDLSQLLEVAIALQLGTAEPFELVPLEWSAFPDHHVYGCRCHGVSGAINSYYLMSWQNAPLSEHQQYGICLYAQAINSQIVPQSVAQPVSRSVKLTSEGGQSQLQEILQRQRHQLRTPLALMLLYVDLLKTTVVDRRSQDWLQHLHTTIQEMHISLDHLTQSPDSANQLDLCDLRQVLHQCLQEMHLWIEQKQLKLVCDAEPLWLRVDEWKIKQVFQNLLTNAIAFSPIAGHITCTWQTFQTEVLIKINDNGPGLSGADLRSLGTPFYSRRLGGTGLGLSIAKQIILEHQGSLWGSNLPDGGAQFCIMLPRSS